MFPFVDLFDDIDTSAGTALGFALAVVVLQWLLVFYVRFSSLQNFVNARTHTHTHRYSFDYFIIDTTLTQNGMS